MKLISFLKRKGLCAPLICLLIVLSLLVLGKLAGLVINITPSMKSGVYKKIPGEVKRGDIVLFCLDKADKKVGLKRHYLTKSYQCDGVTPLIKEVIAVPGDNVTLNDDSIIVNTTQYLYKTRYRDNVGRTLKVYPRNHYLYTKGYWLIGTNSSNSWDSRYWGPIANKQIISAITDLIVW